MAHLYQLNELHDNCEEYLQMSVTKENDVETWKAAGVSGSKKLRHKALRTIARVNIQISCTFAYKALRPESFAKITKLADLAFERHFILELYEAQTLIFFQTNL